MIWIQTTLDSLLSESFSAKAIRSNVSDHTGAELSIMGQDAAQDAAGEAWVSDGLESLRTLLRSKAEVCADDLETVGHPNARGPLFKAAFSRGWCEPAGYAKSKTPSRHAAVVRVWRSLIFSPS